MKRDKGYINRSIKLLTIRQLLIIILITTLTILLVFPTFAQRQSEKLSRGLVAVNTNSGIYLSWRVHGKEWIDVAYNVYRDGILINTSPITESSNYIDKTGSVNNTYSVTAIINGHELSPSSPVNVWSKQYFDIPINKPVGGSVKGSTYTYSANDASTADLDGDGELDIVLKWDPSNSKDNSQDGHTGDVILDAYKLDGTQLWRINLGKNIRAGAHYTQFVVFDFDGDGKAEMACKTADGTVDGTGVTIGNASADYRNSSGRVLEGPEYLTMFDGITGAALSTIDYEAARGSVSNWGDSYGNRVDRFLATAAYLDGEKPSLIMCRGYYNKTTLVAYDWSDGAFTQRWFFNSKSGGLDEYSGQGNHNLAVADVDNDGKDEIIYGQMTIDDDGTGLYTTGLHHGDALHVTDHDPETPGLEVFTPHESGGNGVTFRSAETGKILWQYRKNDDIGRGVAANILGGNRGSECWATGGLGMYDAKGKKIGSNPNSVNFAIYWDGDILRELLDKTSIRKVSNTIYTASGVHSNNSTKATPSLQADMLGDWREEVIWPTNDNTVLRIFTTTSYTNSRVYSLMDDSQYRMAITWQNTAYNQPPHPSFMLENDLALPMPMVFNGLKWKGNAGQNMWNGSKNFLNQNNEESAYSEGDTVIFSFDGVSNESVQLTADHTPGLVVVSSPNDYIFEGAGRLSGSMQLLKHQKGSLTLNGNHTYTGKTVISDGALVVNGTLENSKVFVTGGIWGGVNAAPTQGGRLGGKGTIKGGVVVQNRGALLPGMALTDTLFIENNLEELQYAVNYFDLTANPEGVNDIVVIDGNLILEENIEVKINLLDGQLNTGQYTLFAYTGELIGSIDNINISGTNGMFVELKAIDGKIVLEKPETRQSGLLVWTGSTNNIWDLSGSLNWTMNATPAYFLPQDEVIFNEAGTTHNEILVSGRVNIAQMQIDADANYTFIGEGEISGPGSLIKKGNGKLILRTENTFTGETIIEDGVLSVDNLKNGDLISKLGKAGNEAEKLIINGGTLEITGSTSSTDKGITFGENNATITIPNKSTNQTIGGIITGSGSLVKQGEGTLSILGENSFKGGTNIENGTIQLLSDEANANGLGSGTIVLGNATLKQYDSKNTSNITLNKIHVPETVSAFYELDGRSYNQDELTGSGLLNLSSNFVRTDLQGNWSEFDGIINVMTDGDGGDFRVDNQYGYAKATINLSNKVKAYHLKNDTVEIGQLYGVTGSTLLNSIWKIGANNGDSEYSGIIESEKLIKVGSGRITLSGNNTFSGGTEVRQGSLWLKNKSGSATGTGVVQIYKDALIGGDGFIEGSIEVETGAYISPGDAIGTLTTSQTITLKENSVLSIELNLNSNDSDQLKAQSIILQNPTLLFANSLFKNFAIGDEFTILNASNIEGSFASISPEQPSGNLYWDTSELYSKGIIKVSDIKTSNNAISDQLKPLIYPNPSTGIINIESFSSTEFIEEVIVYSNNGKTINQYQNNKGDEVIQLNLSVYPKGLYLVKIILTNSSNIQKINLF